MTHPHAAFGDYRNIPAPPVGDDPRVDAVALAVCSTGGHIPNRDRPYVGPGGDVVGDACDFHRRMAAGFIRVADAAAPRRPVGRTIPARRTDPDTSKRAAGAVPVRAGTQRARLLEAFGLLSTAAGITDEEAAARAEGVSMGSEYAKRCSELRDAGLIEVVDAPDGRVLTRRGRSGLERMVCRLSEEGARVLTTLDRTP